MMDSMVRNLFTTKKKMIFKNVSTGTIEVTDNMFFLACPTLWQFVGYESEAVDEKD